jgi:SdrD B-like domain
MGEAGRFLGVVICAGLLSLPCFAQTTTPAQPYQDKVIEGIGADDSQTLQAPERDATGWPRGYSLETLLDRQGSSGAKRISGLGLRASGYIDTPLYGSFSGQINLQRADQGSSSSNASSWVIRQVGMPFDGGWQASNQLGMIGLPAPELAQGNSRFSLPTPAMRGIASQWDQAQGLSVAGAWGQAGQFEGFPVAGFRTTEGSYQLLSISQTTRGNGAGVSWSTALAQARQVRSAAGLVQDVASLYAGARFAQLGGTVQVNLIHDAVSSVSAATSDSQNPHGLWLDGNFAQGLHQHNWGVFRMQPGLSWVGLPMASDVQGGYWRHQWRTRQWAVQSSLELVSSVSGLTQAGFFATTNARYQYSASTSYGAALSVRRFATQAQSALAYTQFLSNLGTTRLQADVASAETGERQYKVQLDQEWPEANGLRFSTALALDLERVQSPALGWLQRKGVSLAVTADWPINERFNFSSTAQVRSTSDERQYNLSANLGWRLAAQWSLNASIYAIAGTAQTTALAQSPLNAPAQNTARTQSRGVMISLRYSADAGSASAPIGGARGSAAGRLQGVIFLDDNGNGKRDALEKPAANITVLLNGRFTTTDAQGRYEFSYLAAGSYVLTLSSDNLPLPWSFEQDGRTEARVLTRDTTVVDVGARKQ